MQFKTFIEKKASSKSLTTHKHLLYESWLSFNNTA
jgi:hypothetical protein